MNSNELNLILAAINEVRNTSLAAIAQVSESVEDARSEQTAGFRAMNGRVRTLEDDVVRVKAIAKVGGWISGVVIFLLTFGELLLKWLRGHS